jgi:hypothetical protein
VIDVKRATHEVRMRDRKRRRLVLIIGQKIFHIDEDEAAHLRRQLNTLKGR